MFYVVNGIYGVLLGNVSFTLYFKVIYGCYDVLLVFFTSLTVLYGVDCQKYDVYCLSSVTGYILYVAYGYYDVLLVFYVAYCVIRC